MWPLWLLLAIIPVALGYWIGERGRGERAVRQWAARNNLHLFKVDPRGQFAGPFFLRADEEQLVFRITAKDQKGGTRQGWVRLGAPVVGLLSKRIDVRWDDEPS